jgi:hypothetical protein
VARLTHPNGSVVNVSDEKVDGLLRREFVAGSRTEAGTSGGSRYDDMTVPELKDEVRSRNKDRDDDTRLALTGTKAELVAALQSDDS